MKLVTSKQMQELDQAAIRRGVLALDLMERAGRGLAEIALRLAPKGKGPIGVVAGRGNNGGDGLVAARCLIEAGRDVVVILLASPSDLSPDARANWERLAPLTPRIFCAASPPQFSSFLPQLAQACLVVDAIFGTGLDREVTGFPLQVIRAVNALGLPVVSADIPSGLSADTGEPQGEAIRATATATFGLPKRGLFVGAGPDFTGEVKVVEIGIPPEEIARLDVNLELIEPAIFREHFGPRDPSAHKGRFGHVAIFAGSRGHLGAGYLACLAALRAGAGLATYLLPERAFAHFDARYPEIMCDAIPDGGTAAFHPSGLGPALRAAEGKSTVAIGPAIGTEKPTAAFVNAFVQKVSLPLVIDADGLNVLDVSSLKGRHHPTILTPHPGEMARLLGTTAQAVQQDRLGHVLRLALESQAIVILKGRGSIVATPEGSAAINPTGNAGMATAGMGDALTGVVAAFLAQGMAPLTACMAAVYLHGLAGDLAAAEHGERALITSDVIRKLGEAVKKLEQ